MARRTSEPRWTCWAHDERTYRLGRCESAIVTGARHILYEFATLAEEPGYLPADDEKLARMVGLSLKEWLEIAESITIGWKRVGDKWLVERVFSEMKVAKKVSSTRSKAGKKGGRNKQPSNDLGSPAEAIAPDLLEHEPSKSEAIGSPSPIPHPTSPEERAEKQRLPDGPGTPARDPDHRVLNSGNPAEAEPPFVVQLWTRDRLGEAGRAANETADAFRVGRANLSTWIVLQRQQCRHPRAVVKVLKDAKRIGPEKILNLTGWLNTATKKESPKEFAKDSEAQGVEHRTENAAAATALYGEGTQR